MDKVLEDSLKLIKAYLLGIELERNNKIFIKSNKKITQDITCYFFDLDFNNERIPFIKVNQTKNSEVLFKMIIINRFATSKDIRYGVANSNSYNKLLNGYEFDYIINNIEELKKMLNNYIDYIYYIIRELTKGR